MKLILCAALRAWNPIHSKQTSFAKSSKGGIRYRIVNCIAFTDPKQPGCLQEGRYKKLALLTCGTCFRSFSAAFWKPFSFKCR